MRELVMRSFIGICDLGLYLARLFVEMYELKLRFETNERNMHMLNLRQHRSDIVYPNTSSPNPGLSLTS
jgi:hypothetical protein